MENTACGDKCAFVQSGFCKTDAECPFYTESWWNSPEHPQPKLFRDCFPKRAVLEQQGLLSRFLCLQHTVQSLRNQIANLELLLSQLVESKKENITPKTLQSIESEVKQISEIPIKNEAEKS